jgi:hypothetical protein
VDKERKPCHGQDPAREDFLLPHRKIRESLLLEVTAMLWFFASLLLLPVRLILGSTQGILLHLLMAIGLGIYVLGR